MVKILGSRVAAPTRYAPDILEPIPRELARTALGVEKSLPFGGADVWHLYELSWLSTNQVPVSYVGTLSIPVDTPNLVESKSLKLYLNSLNFESFESDAAAVACIVADVSKVVGGEVALVIAPVDDLSRITGEPEGFVIDTVIPAVGAISAPVTARNQYLSARADDQVEETLTSHLLRSLCPVTGQPDWASLVVHYSGNAIEHAGLLNYVLSYREHQEFHEQCVERIFLDIRAQCAPRTLTVAAFYQRRGGIDITPWRTTHGDFLVPVTRMARQ